MNLAFFKAKCTEECTVPQIGKCIVGKTYKLNVWQARGWFGCFDIKNAEVEMDEVEMDDKDQAEVQPAIDRKLEQQQEFLDMLKNGPAPKKAKVVKPRKEVVEGMGAGKINDLLASYDLPKLDHKDKNVALVLAYEGHLETAKEFTPEQRVEALEKLEIEIPDGEFDQPAAIAKALALNDVDEDEIVEEAKSKKPKADKKSK